MALDMKRGQKTHPDQIMHMLRQIEVRTAPGRSLALACKDAAILEQSHYRWHKKYDGLDIDQAKRMNDLERETARLR